MLPRQPLSAKDLAARLAGPVRAVRVGGFLDDVTQGAAQIPGSVAKGIESAGQGVSQAAGKVADAVSSGVQNVGQGVQAVGEGVGEGLKQAGGGVSDAAHTGAEGAVTAAKWALGLAIGVPLALSLAGITAFVLVGRSAADAAKTLGPHALRVAPDLLPLLTPALGPEAAMAATLATRSGALPMRRPPPVNVIDVAELQRQLAEAEVQAALAPTPRRPDPAGPHTTRSPI